MINVVDKDGNVIGQKEADDIENQWFIGEAIDRIWDYQTLGIYQIGEEAQAMVYGKKPGDWKLRDVNEDGQLTPLDDKVFLGYSTPRYTLGLSNNLTFFKNFEVSAFIRADLGHLKSNPLHLNTESSNNYTSMNSFDVPYWTNVNPINDYGRIGGSSTPTFGYYKTSSFFRLQDLSISYNVPGSTLSKYSIKGVKVYLNFRNLLTFTRWDHFDPESGTYPMPKTSSIGINISL